MHLNICWDVCEMRIFLKSIVFIKGTIIYYYHGSSSKNSTYRYSPPYLLFGIKTWLGSKRFKSARGMKFYFTHAGAYFNWTDNLAIWLTWWV